MRANPDALHSACPKTPYTPTWSAGSSAGKKLMKRREFIGLVGGVAASWLGGMSHVRGQAARVYRIGILETVPAEVNVENLAALRRGLREHGYVEGQNLRIEYRSAEGRADQFPDLAAELIRLGVDLIVTRGTPAAKAAKQATATIPVVMAAIGEPLGVGVVATLAHPGGNVTGFSAFTSELSGKRVELLKEVFPAVSRVGFLNNMSNPVAPPQWETTKTAGDSLGIATELLDVRVHDDIPRACSAAA